MWNPNAFLIDTHFEDSMSGINYYYKSFLHEYVIFVTPLVVANQNAVVLMHSNLGLL